MNAGDKEILWVISKIIRKFKISRKGMAVRFDVNEKEKDAPTYSDQIEVLDKLKMFEIIKVDEKATNEGFDVIPNTECELRRIEILQPAFDIFLLRKYGIKNKDGNYFFPENLSLDENTKNFKQPKKIKSMRLDESTCILNINNSEDFISFASRKNKNGLKKETKKYKVLVHLWEFRRETKKGRIVSGQDGSFEVIENLTKASGSISEGATRKTISRLEEMFVKNGLPIKIDVQKGKYRLSVELD